MPRDYVYDQGFSEERTRLAGIESLWDPGSQALIDALGITDGWRCLEVGAGGGALVQWMAGCATRWWMPVCCRAKTPTRPPPASPRTSGY